MDGGTSSVGNVDVTNRPITTVTNKSWTLAPAPGEKAVISNGFNRGPAALKLPDVGEHEEQKQCDRDGERKPSAGTLTARFAHPSSARSLPVFSLCRPQRAGLPRQIGRGLTLGR